jgi:hypothetical protein
MADGESDCLVARARSLLSEASELTHRNSLATTTLACAVSTPLIGGGVAEWLKAAVC